MKRLSLSILILFLNGMKLLASHIVGGEMTYQYVSNSGSNTNYKVVLYLYVDCKNGRSESIAQDKLGYIHVFAKSNAGVYSNYNSYVLKDAMTGPVQVSDVKYNCILNKPEVCVDKYTYTINITLPNNQNGYVISFERCCRNSTITNINLPENTGATYWSAIPGSSLVSKNSSPYFKSLPPNFICLNAPLSFDHSAIDNDGDSLVYELFTPYNGGTANNPSPQKGQATNPSKYTNVNWLNVNGYNVANQIDGQPGLSINRSNGKLTLTPTVAGQFVIGIKVLEYRNGVLIGETKRDLQFNVSNCVFSVVSSLTAPLLNCSESAINFKNLSQGATEYHWDFGVTNLIDDTSIIKSPSYNYLNSGNYTVKLISKNSSCADTFEFDLAVVKKFVTQLPKDTVYCGPFTAELKSNLFNKNYLWNTNETTNAIKINKAGMYWLRVTEGPCTSSDSINVYNGLSKIDLGRDSVICGDNLTPFVFQGVSGYISYLWNDQTQLQSVKINQAGIYSVTATDDLGCKSVDSIQFTMYPFPNPNLLRDTQICEGSFTLLNAANPDAKFVNEDQFKWNNGATTSSISVSKPGTYSVIVNNAHCSVSASAKVSNYVSDLELGQDTFYCGTVSRTFKLSDQYVSYLWDDFYGSNVYLLTQAGKLKVAIETVNGCIFTDSVTITQFPVPDAKLANDTDVCVSTLVHIEAAAGMKQYEWSTGANTSSIDVRDAGKYKVTITDVNSCKVSDSMSIFHNGNALPSEMYMPDAFTPNDDQINDLFPSNQYSDPGTDYKLSLFNRWGEQIFETSNPAQQWDGTVNGDKAPEAVYVFLVNYVGCDGTARTFRGTFTLLR